MLALALTDAEESVAAAAAAALALQAAVAGGGENDGRVALRTAVSMEDAAAASAAAAAAVPRTTISMEDAEEAGGNAVDLSSCCFPFARPRALLFSIRGGSAPSPSLALPLERTLSWLVKLVLDDDDGLSENAVLSLSLLPPPPNPFSSASASRGRSSPLFCLDSDAAAASSARLLWGLISLCGGDIDGNERRERYGARLVSSLLALLRAAAAAAPPRAVGDADERAAPLLSAAPPPSPPSLLLRSVSLAAQALGAWVPVAAWLGPATTTTTATGGSGGGGASGRGGGSSTSGGGGGEEEEEGAFEVEVDLGLRCGLLRLLLFGLAAASKLEEGGTSAPAEEKGRAEENDGGRRWTKRRVLRAGGEVEAVAAVAVAAVASAAASPSPSPSSSARSVLSLVSALMGASEEGELRKLDAGRRAELWLAVVASEEEEEGLEDRRRRPPPPEEEKETVSSRLAAACGFASTAALAAEHAPAVLERICRVREREKRIGRGKEELFERERLSKFFQPSNSSTSIKHKIVFSSGRFELDASLPGDAPAAGPGPRLRLRDALRGRPEDRRGSLRGLGLGAREEVR